ncbi:MAG: agmatinase [Myxococcota bacterium]|nr:agmatinase [Myxococcota bacterium]
MGRHFDIECLDPGMVAVLGVPSDENSSYMRGPAAGPTIIRNALRCDATNLSTECGLDLSTHSGWTDLGDLVFENQASAVADIERHFRELLLRDVRALALGGDHAVTYPIVRAHADTYKDLTLVHLDAHPDLYDIFNGNRFSNACPFARIMEQGLAARLVQVGIRTMTPHQQDQANRFGVEVIRAADVGADLSLELAGPVYLSLDIDVLDPAFAPGVSHPEPGGLSTRDVISIIGNMGGQIVGADIVELNPRRDPQGITAMVAAKLLKEILGKMLRAGPNT